ncbi:ParB/RepB/Spo0J family partition protein [Sandarakinorhabdus cyanobacteriorum]|uniref:ParB/RepB/Spo0J family partition protein n=1 Tax=Sandarakinorhabdus cyanobacteriorum TaxID=1981098 RepID=UPI0013FDE024|nr:ParB/RepB/Spo0J family partition protein [Sandarakinorhabdus cyanobacteriorum]
MLPVPAAPSDRFQAAEDFTASHLALDPARVRVWPGNARRYDRLNATNCRELIDSMIDAGGQQVPAILRRTDGHPDFDFEVIAGVRRHFAVSWLKAHGHTHFQFLGVVHELTDEQAFFIADLENRTRKDVSDIERARSYRAALDSHYHGSQSRMAARLRISKGWLSKMLTVADVPDTILEAFENVEKVSLAGLYPVARLLYDPATARAVVEEAARIATENGNRSWDKAKPIPEPEVIRRLKSVALGRSPSLQQKAPESSSFPTQSIGLEVQSPDGHSIVTVIDVDVRGITLRLHNQPGVQHEDVLLAVAKVMEQLGR